MDAAHPTKGWWQPCRTAIGRRQPSSPGVPAKPASRGGAGLRQSGVIAPLVLDGPMTGPAFKAYVEQLLAPALSPGDVVVLDNLAVHKVDGVRQAIAALGAFILYLPPYSPDLNPIEQLFAKLKALLRKTTARTKDALSIAIGSVLLSFRPDECANYLTHCRYGST
jgi:transposase